jgi:crossover junction endodeoxyribonuclease RusA
MVSVDLPFPPSANRLWRYVGGRPIKSADYRAWLEEAAQIVAIAKTRRTVGPFGLSVQVGRKDKRKRDIDNFLKPLLDAIQAGGAVEDDSDCEHLEMRWRPELPGVRVRVLPTKRAA